MSLTASDMDISDPDDEPNQPRQLVKEEEEQEQEGRVDCTLAAKLASALLSSVLFTKGQIPT